MRSERLTMFSDGVLAIVLTIMVLELKVPHEPTLQALLGQWPLFVSYLLSFIYVAIYWNNHHHLFQIAPHVDGRVMWANMHLLFWLSLLPFTTAWTGENYAQMLPTVVYGGVLLMCSVAYYMVQRMIVRLQGPKGNLAQALGRDWKGRYSPAFYATGMVLAWVNPWLGIAVYVAVAGLWLMPDRRIEKVA